MGTASASALERIESELWLEEHCLKPDGAVASTNQRLIRLFKSPLYLCYREVLVEGACQHKHYFVTDLAQVMEFGNGMGITGQAAAVHAELPEEYETEKELDLSSDMRKRMISVAGATNFSLLLRNSEHFAKYICTGAWLSSQSQREGAIAKHFGNLRLVPPAVQQHLNTLPRDLERAHMIRPLFKGAPEFLRYKDRLKVLPFQDAKRGYNVLFLGPTGSGKSNLINMLFNRSVCKSVAGARSVTRQVQFIQGEVPHWPGCADRVLVNIVDTVGFCDSDLSATDVDDLIKGHVDRALPHIDKVVIVVSDRLERGHADAVKRYMAWLRYPQYPSNFVLIYNKADILTEMEREQALSDAASALSFGCEHITVPPLLLQPSRFLCGEETNAVTSYESRTHLGFPPRASFAAIEEDLHRLLDLVLTPVQDRIPVEKSWCQLL